MNDPTKSQTPVRVQPDGSANLGQLEERLRQQAEAGDTEGFHATLSEIESLSAQDRTLLAILAVCLIGRPPNDQGEPQPAHRGHPN